MILLYICAYFNGYFFREIKEIRKSLQAKVKQSLPLKNSVGKPVRSLIVEDMTPAQRAEKETRDLIESLNK